MTAFSSALILMLMMANPAPSKTVTIEHSPDLEVSPAVAAALHAAIDRDHTTAVAIRIVKSDLWVLALVFGKADRTASGRCGGPVVIYGPTDDEPPAWQRLPAALDRKLSYAIIASEPIADCSHPKGPVERIALGGELSVADVNAITAAIQDSPLFAKSAVIAIVLEDEAYATATVIVPDGTWVDVQMLKRDEKWTVAPLE